MRQLGYVVLVTSLWCEKIGAQNYEAPSTPFHLGSSSSQSGKGSQGGTKSAQGIKISVRDSSISYVLAEIARQANIKLLVDEGSSEVSRRISINLSTSRPIDAITKVLEGTNLEPISASDGTILVRKRASSSSRTAQEQEGSLSGQVVDSATGKPIGGATVELQRLSKKVITNDKGMFAFPGIAPGSHVVTVRLIGYRSTSKTVTIEPGKKATLNIVLPAAASVLSGVVTTATGTQRKVEVGNDVTTIDVEDIIQKNPVSSVSDLLATRVPGVIVEKASGEPGAKTSIRIRGIGSIRASNEPIIIVDGVQVLSERNESGTAMSMSPIDQLDVNSISKIEVLKGPSAVALYGSNAANGVIVITTKRGHDGPARWNVATRLSRETMPGKWPQNYFAWGEDLTAGLGTVHCPRSAWGVSPDCRYDSTTVYQILNNPRTTVFGTGSKKELSMGLAGGNRQFTYALTGTYSLTSGLLKLPDADVALLKAAGIGVTNWQRRPQGLESYSGAATFGLMINDQSDIRYSTTFTRYDRRSTPLIQALTTSGELDPSVMLYNNEGEIVGTGSGLLVKIPNVKRNEKGRDFKFTNSAQYRKNFFREITLDAVAGMTFSNGEETYLLKKGDYCPLTGTINIAFGNCTNRDDSLLVLNSADADYVNYRTSANITDFRLNVSGSPKGHSWLNVTPYIGFVGNNTVDGKNGIGAIGLPVGGHGIQGASRTGVLEDLHGTRRTVGVFAEARVQVAERIWIPFSVRTDVGNAIGSETKPIFPRLSFSYLISDQPSFRNIPLLGMFPELKLRSAFGIAGKQPGLADKHRTFRFTDLPINGVNTTIADLNSIGNTKLYPETSRELELGFDATFFDNARSRVLGTFTLVRKHTSNLLGVEMLAPSLGFVQSRVSNVGDLTNNLIEVSVDGYTKIGSVGLSTSNLISTLRNKLVRLNSLSTQLEQSNKSSTKVAYRLGYPVDARWAFPIAGYVDGNQDGIIQANEVVYGDSLNFLGPSTPNFTYTNNSQITVGPWFTIASTISYEDGSTQEASERTRYSRASNDPTLSLEDQVKLLYDANGIMYKASTLRLNSLQITYLVPGSFTARYLSKKSVQIAVSGNNLGLWSTFSGKDPGVGVRNLPIPRTLGISVRIQ